MPSSAKITYCLNPSLRPVPAPGGKLLIYGCKSDDPVLISQTSYQAIINFISGTQSKENNATISKELCIDNDEKDIIRHLLSIDFIRPAEPNDYSSKAKTNELDAKALGLYPILDLSRLDLITKRVTAIDLLESQKKIYPFLLIALAFFLYNFYFGFLRPEREALSSNFLGQASIVEIFLCFTISSFFTMIFKSFLSQYSGYSYSVLYLKFLAGFHPIFDLGPDPSFSIIPRISKSNYLTLISANYIMRIYILIACLILLALWGPLNTSILRTSASIISILINISLVSIAWQLIPSPGSLAYKCLEINGYVPDKFLGKSLRNTLMVLKRSQLLSFEEKTRKLFAGSNKKYTLMLLYTLAISACKLLFIAYFVIPGFANDLPALFGRWSSSIVYIILLVLSFRYILSNFNIGILRKTALVSPAPVSHLTRITDYQISPSNSEQRDYLNSNLNSDSSHKPTKNVKPSGKIIKAKRSLMALTLRQFFTIVIAISLIPFPISFTGSAEVLQSSSLSIKNSETLPVFVANIYADGPSKHVIKKGTLIARLDSPALTAQIQEAQQTIAKLKADNSALQVQKRSLITGSKLNAALEYTNKLESAQADYEKNLEYVKSYSIQLPIYQSQANAYKELSKAGGVSYVQYEDKLIALHGIQLNLEAAKKSAKTALENLKIAKIEKNLNQKLQLGEDIDTINANIKSNERDIAKNKFTLADLQRRSNDLSIKMPFDGVIDSDTTGLVGKKLSFGDELLSVKKSPLTLIQVTISEYDRTFIEVGNSCVLKLQSRWRQSFDGIVASISPTTTLVNGAQSVLINIDLKHPLDSKYIGATGYAKIKNGYTNLLWNMLRPVLRFLSVDIWSILP